MLAVGSRKILGVELRTIPGVDKHYLAGSDGIIYSTHDRGPGRKRGDDSPKSLVARLTSMGRPSVSVVLPGRGHVPKDVHRLYAQHSTVSQRITKRALTSTGTY